MNRYFLRPPKDDSDKTEAVERLGELREVNERRHKVLDYMLLRMSAEEIAEELGEQVKIIKNDMQVIAEKGFRGREEELSAIRIEAVAKLRYTFDEARRAFKNSQGVVETKTTEYGKGGDTTGNGDANVEKEKVKSEEKAGDPRFLQVMNDSVEKMSKVTGAQKHREVEINNNVDNRQVKILSHNRETLPEEYDEFLRKPADALTPEQRQRAGLDQIEEED